LKIDKPDMASRMNEDGLPMIAAENFIETEFEDKFLFYVQQFGLAGIELITKTKMTDTDFDIPNVDTELTWIEKKPDPNDRLKTIDTVKKENLLTRDANLYKARLQNGLRKKEEYITNKQKLCSKLMMRLERSLRVSVQQHKDYVTAIKHWFLYIHIGV